MANLASIATQGRRWVLMPLFFGQLFTGAKSFEANPLLGSRRLNEMGLHKARVAMAYRRAQARREKLAAVVSAEDQAAYERDGFIVRRNFLPQDVFDRLKAEVEAYRGRSEERIWGETVNRKITIDHAATRAMPTLKTVMEFPEWRNLIAYVGASASPPLAYIQSLFRRGGDIDPQTRLHIDTFHATAKAWLYLTDVKKNEGAFTYVPGSHKLTPAKLEWAHRLSLAARDSDDRETREGSFRIEAGELASLGLPQPVELDVPANTLVVGDTSGFHARGPGVAGALRVEIWGLGRRQPFMSWGGLEPWRTLDMGSALSFGQRALKALGAKPRHWKERFGVSAFDMSDPDAPTANGAKSA